MSLLNAVIKQKFMPIRHMTISRILADFFWNEAFHCQFKVPETDHEQPTLQQK